MLISKPTVWWLKILPHQFPCLESTVKIIRITKKKLILRGQSEGKHHRVEKMWRKNNCSFLFELLNNNCKMNILYIWKFINFAHHAFRQFYYQMSEKPIVWVNLTNIYANFTAMYIIDVAQYISSAENSHNFLKERGLYLLNLLLIVTA